MNPTSTVVEEAAASLENVPETPVYRVVHLATTVQSIFGIADEAGNITQRRPVVLESEVLTEDALRSALTALQQQARLIGREFLAEAPATFAPLPE